MTPHASTAIVNRNVIDAETGEIVSVDPNLGMEVAQARAAVERYRELTAAILEPEDYQQAGEKRFVKRSGWQKVSRAYSISTTIVSIKIDRDEDGQILRASAIARATAPDGRTADGNGVCAITEDRFTSRKGRAKVDHDIESTSVTRAKNRAIADLVGFGQVSAEELDADTAGAAAPAPAMPHWAKPADAQQVMALADQLVLVLSALGDPTPSDTVRLMGAVIREHCGGGLPNVIGLLAALIADEAARSLARGTENSAGEAPPVPADGDPGVVRPIPPPEAPVPADGPETASDDEESA